jgi:hypothetical protein
MGLLSTVLAWFRQGRPELIDPNPVSVIIPTASITIARGYDACLSTDMRDADDWEGCKD